MSGVGRCLPTSKKTRSVWCSEAVAAMFSGPVVTAIAQQNIQEAAGQIGQPPADKAQQFQLTINTMGRLSTRERQIAYYVARGMKNKDIGQELKISENTVKRHLQSIFAKTGARDRLELAVLALSEISKAA